MAGYSGVKLFAKGKGQAGAQAQAATFSPIDRIGLLGLLDQVVNSSQSGVLELREPRGEWVYGFQNGALTHARGGRVRGARQAFDLLWEFQSGEFMFTPGVNASLAGNLYIDKARLQDLLRRSQAALQGPSAPYIPPDQQRPIAPVTWQPAAPPGQYTPPPQPAQYAPPPQPGQYAPQPWPPAGQPGMPPAPAWGAPQQPGYPTAPYPGAPYPGAPYPGAQPQNPAYAAQGYPQAPPGMRPPAAAPQPGYPAYPPQPQAMPPQMMPPQQPVAPPPVRPVTPQSFSVPPMAIPRKREAVPTYQPPAPAQAPLASPPPQAAKPATPKDDLASLRASLVAQAPPLRAAPTAPGWGVRSADGKVAALAGAAAGPKGKGKERTAKTKGDSKFRAAVKVQLIKFLLWACERKYSPDDHWTLKDAFEVSTMELRDQFIGAFSESFKASKKARAEDEDVDDMAAGRMRGRGRRH